MAEQPQQEEKTELPSKPGYNSMALRLFLTSASALAAETSTFPIDVTKTRLQLNPQASFKGSFTTAFEIALQEGPSALYKGLPPALLRHLIYTPLRILSYEHLRSTLLHDHETVAGRALIGGLSGLLAQVVASPADLIKVRMQADGRMRQRYKGVGDAVGKILRAEGILGLWRGLFPNVQRAFLVNMGELACYDQAKRSIVRSGFCDDGVYAHTLSSVISGLSATALSCPADVVKTRMMNQAGKEYRGTIDCVVKTVKREGVRSLWKGFFPTWARLGPWQFVFWVSYEKLRSVAGLSSF